MVIWTILLNFFCIVGTSTVEYDAWMPSIKKWVLFIYGLFIFGSSNILPKLRLRVRWEIQFKLCQIFPPKVTVNFIERAKKTLIFSPNPFRMLTIIHFPQSNWDSRHQHPIERQVTGSLIGLGCTLRSHTNRLIFFIDLGNHV